METNLKNRSESSLQELVLWTSDVYPGRWNEVASEICKAGSRLSIGSESSLFEMPVEKTDVFEILKL